MYIVQIPVAFIGHCSEACSFSNICDGRMFGYEGEWARAYHVAQAFKTLGCAIMAQVEYREQVLAKPWNYPEGFLKRLEAAVYVPVAHWPRGIDVKFPLPGGRLVKSY